jgi:hypothetical protein
MLSGSLTGIHSLSKFVLGFAAPGPAAGKVKCRGGGALLHEKKSCSPGADSTTEDIQLFLGFLNA